MGKGKFRPPEALKPLNGFRYITTLWMCSRLRDLFKFWEIPKW